MRYIVLVAIALLGAFITGGVAPQLPILGAEPDLMLILMLALTLREHTVTPVLVCSVAAIFMDVFFAPALGYYSFPYLLIGAVVFLVTRNMQVPRVVVPSVICAAAWVLKELFTALLTFLMGHVFDFWYIFLHSTLPGVLVCAVLMFPIYLLINWLCGFNFMRPRSISIEEEFPHMLYSRRGRRSEQTNRGENGWRS